MTFNEAFEKVFFISPYTDTLFLALIVPIILGIVLIGFGISFVKTLEEFRWIKEAPMNKGIKGVVSSVVIILTIMTYNLVMMDPMMLFSIFLAGLIVITLIHIMIKKGRKDP